MSDDKQELIRAIDNIRGKFKTEFEDPDKTQMSFIDELNELIRKIFKDDPADVYTTLSQGQLEKWKKRRFRRWLSRTFKNIDFKTVFYFLLLSTITGFLVSEAVSFYAAEGSSNAKTWLKAILTEVAFIFLSGYRSADKIQAAFVSLLRVGVFSLMLFVISSNVIYNTVSTTSESDRISEQVVLLEDHIKKKEETIKFYRDKGWGISVNKHEQERDKLLDKLIKLKEEQTSGKNEEVSDNIRHQSYGRAAFRILLMLISVLITRRLFKF